MFHLCPDELGPLMQLFDVTQQWLITGLRAAWLCGKKFVQYPKPNQKTKQTKKSSS